MASTDTAPGKSATPRSSGPRKARRRATSRHATLAWVAVIAGCAAAAVLAVVTFAGGSDDQTPDPRLVPGAHSGIVEHGSIRSIEGSVEDGIPAVGGSNPGAHSGIVEHGSIRSIEGSIEDTVPNAGH